RQTAQQVSDLLVIKLFHARVAYLSGDVLDDKETLASPDGGLDSGRTHGLFTARAGHRRQIGYWGFKGHFRVHTRTICMAASKILGASGRSQAIIPSAPGPGTSGNAIFRAFTPGTAWATSAMMWEP